MFLVGWLPNPPDQISIHTIILNYPTPFPSHLVFSFSFLLCYSLTGASPFSFSLLHSQPSPSLSSSSFFTVKLLAQAHGSFFTSTGSQQFLHRHGLMAVSSPTRSSSLFSLSAFAWGRTRRHGVAPDQVRPHQIW